MLPSSHPQTNPLLLPLQDKWKLQWVVMCITNNWSDHQALECVHSFPAAHLVESSHHHIYYNSGNIPGSNNKGISYIYRGNVKRGQWRLLYNWGTTWKKTKMMFLNTYSANKADRETEQTGLAESVCDACLDGERDPSRHCWLALRGCKTGNNLWGKTYSYEH